MLVGSDTTLTVGKSVIGIARILGYYLSSRGGELIAFESMISVVLLPPQTLYQSFLILIVK